MDPNCNYDCENCDRKDECENYCKGRTHVLADVNSLKEFERIPNPELINEDDLLLIEDETGQLKTVKYKDLIHRAALESGLIGPIGPTGPTGHPGVDIVEEYDNPDPEAVIWVKEGIYPEEDLANNIESYLYDFIVCGEYDTPYEDPAVTDKTLIYFQVDEEQDGSDIRVVKIPNDQTAFQRQLDILRERIDDVANTRVQVYDEEGYIDPPEELEE